MKAGLAITLGIPFVLQFAFKSILKKVWPLFLTMQLAGCLLLVQNQYAPINVVSVEEQLTNIYTLQVIPPDQVLSMIDKSQETLISVISSEEYESRKLQEAAAEEDD